MPILNRIHVGIQANLVDDLWKFNQSTDNQELYRGIDLHAAAFVRFLDDAAIEGFDFVALPIDAADTTATSDSSKGASSGPASPPLLHLASRIRSAVSAPTACLFFRPSTGSDLAFKFSTWSTSVVFIASNWLQVDSSDWLPTGSGAKNGAPGTADPATSPQQRYTDRGQRKEPTPTASDGPAETRLMSATSPTAATRFGDRGVFLSNGVMCWRADSAAETAAEPPQQRHLTSSRCRRLSSSGAESETAAACSSLLLRTQLSWAIHCSVYAVITPSPLRCPSRPRTSRRRSLGSPAGSTPTGEQLGISAARSSRTTRDNQNQLSWGEATSMLSTPKFNSLIAAACRQKDSPTQFWVRIPLALDAYAATRDNKQQTWDVAWQLWNQVRCSVPRALRGSVHVALELDDEGAFDLLPAALAPSVIERWTAEPVRCIIVPLSLLLRLNSYSDSSPRSAEREGTTDTDLIVYSTTVSAGSASPREENAISACCCCFSKENDEATGTSSVIPITTGIPSKGCARCDHRTIGGVKALPTLRPSLQVASSSRNNHRSVSELLLRTFSNFSIQIVIADDSGSTRGPSGKSSQAIGVLKNLFDREQLEARTRRNLSVGILYKDSEPEYFKYLDFAQRPLQPLRDNLESQAYETFEQDPVKYLKYEEAVLAALSARIRAGHKNRHVVFVVGAGRGPIVDSVIRAFESARISPREGRVIALDKNPNAVITLKYRSETERRWLDFVEVVEGDMRFVEVEHRADILVSELLGSFGDNELSPECLDGAQRLLSKSPAGICIPSYYCSTIEPVAVPVLWDKCQDLESPYVVNMHAAYRISVEGAKECMHFQHPKRFRCLSTENSHNERFADLSFTARALSLCHGFAGYFNCTLFEGVTLSTSPLCRTPELLSWFPLFFPLKIPVLLAAGEVIRLQMWRLSDKYKVWYEWCVVSAAGTSELHNAGGASFSMFR